MKSISHNIKIDLHTLKLTRCHGSTEREEIKQMKITTRPFCKLLLDHQNKMGDNQLASRTLLHQETTCKKEK